MTQEQYDELEDAPRFALITESALDALRRLIGVRITETVDPWCYEVTRDNVRHYAHGIGDDNPLWSNPAYAATTSIGRISAPPSFLFALDRVFSGYVGGLPGVHAMWSGASTNWHRRLVVGDDIRTEVFLKDLIEHDTRFAGRAIQQIYHVDFYDQDDQLVADGDSWCFRTERDTARELGTKYAEIHTDPPLLYSDEELARIWSLYDNETIRGSEPRYVEETHVGETLPPLMKGPMTVTGFICFAQGWGGLYIRANRMARKQLRRHPGLGIPDRFGIPDVPERVHWDDELAKAVGTPGAYDYGPERCSWLIQQITDWMGDDGYLVSHSCQIRRHNPIGDTVTVSGAVDKVTIGANGDKLVEVTQRAVNQEGELSATGHGVIRLPSQEG